MYVCVFGGHRYLTEGIFEVEGMLDALAKALARPAYVQVVWVAETDMRYGWPEFAAGVSHFCASHTSHLLLQN